MQAVEMRYLRSACGVSRMDGMSNENVYECFGMCHTGEWKVSRGGRNEATDLKVVWPQGANEGE